MHTVLLANILHQNKQIFCKWYALRKCRALKSAYVMTTGVLTGSFFQFQRLHPAKVHLSVTRPRNLLLCCLLMKADVLGIPKSAAITFYGSSMLAYKLENANSSGGFLQNLVIFLNKSCDFRY